MSAARLAEAFDQLQQLYALRELHQTLIARLQYYQQQHDVQMERQRELMIEMEMPNDARFIFTVDRPQALLQFPRSLEDMMLMRAIQMSLETAQPSTAPPPITKEDSGALKKVEVTTKFLKKLSVECCEDCAICQDSFSSMLGEEVVRLPCDHFFCEDCVTQWLQTSRTCPVCRTELVHVEKLYGERRNSRVMPVTPPAPQLPPPQQSVQQRVLPQLARSAAPAPDPEAELAELRRQQQQAELLEEIMTNRDARQQAAVGGPRPPPPRVAPVRSSEPQLSVVRRSSSNAPEAARVVAQQQQQGQPVRRTSQLTVGRPRASISGAISGSIRSGSVGVRGILNSRRAS